MTDIDETMVLLTRTRLKEAREQAERTIQVEEFDPLKPEMFQKDLHEDFAVVVNDDVPQQTMIDQIKTTGSHNPDPFQSNILIPRHNYGSGLKIHDAFYPFKDALDASFYARTGRRW